MADYDMNLHNKNVQTWEKFYVVCCLVSIFTDPLFYWLLSVQQNNMCIAFDWPMARIIVVLRSITDVVYLLEILVKLVDQPKRIAKKYLMGKLFIEIFLCLPLPQIIVFGASHAKNLMLWAILIQYVPRLFRFLPPLVGKSSNGLIFETGWANFVINLFTYMLSGHIIGSCWYLFGLQRVQQCLHDACSDTGFGHTCLHFINCGDFNGPNNFEFDPNWKNWTKNENATACFSGDSFIYGIYKPAVNLSSKGLTTRYAFSLFWGLQQLSTLVGNQQPSYFVQEILFLVLIIVVGLLLFSFLLGNMQNFLLAFGRRRQELSLTGRDVEKWMRHQSFPTSLKKRVRAAEVCN